MLLLFGGEAANGLGMMCRCNVEREREREKKKKRERKRRGNYINIPVFPSS